MSKTNVLVLGAGGNAGRNYIKCLRMSDDVGRIAGVDLNKYYLEGSGADAKCLMPKFTHEADKVGYLQAVIEEYDIGFIHAQPDAEVEFLGAHQDEFRGKMVSLDQSVIAFARDKEACQELWGKALDLNFQVGKFVDSSLKSFEAMRGAEGKVWVRTTSGAGSRGALPVTRLDEATAWVNFWVNNRGLNALDFMLAPYLPGPEYAVQMVFWHGELIHCQARERVVHFFATLSPSGQSSTPAVARTVTDKAVTTRAQDAVMLITAKAAPTQARPHGIYCVDLRCTDTGDIIPTECNYGRFFTTMDFFATLGLNSPEALIRLHAGFPVEPMLSALPANRYWVRGLDQTPVLLP